ncbi:hypothetical protein Tco_0318644 [Tanacetum coccineum]
MSITRVCYSWTIIYDSLVKQFWSTASLRASEEGPPAILATIDRTPYTITESLVRSQLQLDDEGGVEDLPIADIYLGDHMPLLGTMLPPAQAAIAGESSGEAAPSNPQTVPETIIEPDHSHDQESTPPRPTTTTSSSPMTKQGPSSDPNIASSSRPHESAPDLFTSTNVEDETMGGSFHTSPPRSTQAPPKGTTSGGAEDLDKLTALSSLVSTLVQKVNTQESELTAHKLLFKEVVGKLVKKVKFDISPLFIFPSDEFAGGSDVPAGATTGPSADPSNKGKSPLLEEDPPVRERTFRQREEDRLGEEAARKMYEEEKDELIGMINGQFMPIKDSFIADLLGRLSMKITLLKDGRSLKRPGADLEQASSKKSKSTESLKSSVPDDSQQPSVEVPSQKATIEDVKVSSKHDFSHTHCVLTHDGWYLEERLGRKGLSYSLTIPIEDGDPEAEHKMCIKYASDADSASDDDTPVNLYAVVDWELLPTGLGSINVFYRKDNSRKCFTSLREILHLVTRADLMTIYGRVMTFYQDTKAAGVGLVLWGDLKVLMDSPEVNDGSDVWKNQHTWSIQSWKLYSYSGVHVLETVSGLVVHMFVDKKYPLSVNLIERMLDHQLEICHGPVGNELTTAV